MTSETDNQTWKEKVYEIFLEERRLVDDKYFQQSSQLSKLILTLAAGSLTFSVTFLKVISKAEKTCLLKWSWVFLIITILFGCISVFFSTRALKKQGSIVDKYYDKLLKTDPQKWNTIKPQENCWNRFVEISNGLVGVSFIGAFILLVIFMISNS